MVEFQRLNYQLRYYIFLPYQSLFKSGRPTFSQISFCAFLSIPACSKSTSKNCGLAIASPTSILPNCSNLSLNSLENKKSSFIYLLINPFLINPYLHNKADPSYCE